MSPSRKKVPLGAILQQAGLVSADNVKEALQQQCKNSQDLRIGEILADRGYIDSKTADFFAESWPILIKKVQIQPIGQYFRQARLLDEEQIKVVLEKQKKSKLKFGEQAVKQGFLNQTTVDFFLQSLSYKSIAKFDKIVNKPEPMVQNTQKVQDSFYKIKLKLLNLEDREDFYKTVLDRVLFWTEGQSFLTQKLFKLITENQAKVVAGKEAKQVDYLIQNKILKNWRNQIAGKHLQTIEARLLNNQQSEPIELLELYQQILTTEVTLDRSQKQQELTKIGLVARQQEHLVVANRIYKSVFDSSWIQEKLTDINREKKLGMAVVPVQSTAIVSTFKEKEQKKLSLKNLLLLLTLIALLLVFFNNLTKRIKVRTAFKQGNKFLQQKSFSEAISEYNKLLNIDSNYFQAWTNRGYALAGLQKYEEMRQSCSAATIIAPTAVYAWNCQGEALHNLQREEEAINAFDKAIALNKSDPIFLINKSESLKSLGKEEESLTTISEAIKVLEQIEAIKGKDEISSEFAVALTFLGNGYRKKEKYEPAIFSYNRALEYSPNYFPAQLGKGIILSRVKRYLQAQEEFESILENKELSIAKQAQTWFYLGKTLCQSGQNAESIIAFEQAIERNTDYQAAKEAKKNCE